MTGKRFDPKDPQGITDYGFDWTDELDGDTIVTSIWVVTGGGVSKDSDDRSGNVTTVWVSGGVDGEEALLKNTVVTTDGRTHERTAVLPIQSR